MYSKTISAPTPDQISRSIAFAFLGYISLLALAVHLKITDRQSSLNGPEAIWGLCALAYFTLKNPIATMITISMGNIPASTALHTKNKCETLLKKSRHITYSTDMGQTAVYTMLSGTLASGNCWQYIINELVVQNRLNKSQKKEFVDNFIQIAIQSASSSTTDILLALEHLAVTTIEKSGQTSTSSKEKILEKAHLKTLTPGTIISFINPSGAILHTGMVCKMSKTGTVRIIANEKLIGAEHGGPNVRKISEFLDLCAHMLPGKEVQIRITTPTFEKDEL